MSEIFAGRIRPNQLSERTDTSLSPKRPRPILVLHACLPDAERSSPLVLGWSNTRSFQRTLFRPETAMSQSPTVPAISPTPTTLAEEPAQNVENAEVPVPAKKKKKKRAKKPKAPAADPSTKASPPPVKEEAPPALCISRNKHWKYISSYHVCLQPSCLVTAK